MSVLTPANRAEYFDVVDHHDPLPSDDWTETELTVIEFRRHGQLLTRAVYRENQAPRYWVRGPEPRPPNLSAKLKVQIEGLASYNPKQKQTVRHVDLEGKADSRNAHNSS